MSSKTINWKIVFISSLTLITLDFMYLYLNQEWYIKETELSQSKMFELKWTGVFLRYLTQIVGLNIFVLQNGGSVSSAFLFGLIIYGNYIGTNYATISRFDESLAFFDFLKGGTIMALTAYIAYLFV
jgi:uncharacterized membrane protein